MNRLRGRAWWLLAVFALTFVMFGVTDVLGGANADPAIAVTISGLSPAEVQAQEPNGYRLYDFVSRSAGSVLVLVGGLLAAIVAIPYRAGQRWAWWTLWLLPAWAALVPVLYLVYGTTPGQPPAPPMISGPIVAVMAIVALLADRRRFTDGGTVAHSPAAPRLDGEVVGSR